ncbi:MAG: rod-binding protein [Sulfitobacter sp.]|nr:rod-binding protein [Sulfitobacter sp.]
MEISTEMVGAAQTARSRDMALRQAAEELEASFLSEMLGAAGLGAARESFGGGAGEDQFASLLRQEQARAMVAQGGIGLAQAIFEALKEKHDDA